MSLFKRLCAALLLLCAAGTVHAQATSFTLPTCIHKSVWTPFGTGSDWVHDTSAPVKATGVRVSWWGWWCPVSDGTWTPYVHMCVEGRTCLTATQVTIELDTAMRSSDRLSALRAAIQSYQTAPLANEIEDFRFALASATVAMQAVKPPGSTPPPTPTPTPGTYIVTGSQAFPLKPDGTRSTTPIATAPTKGETCDCSGANRILQFGATFCKVPSLSTAQTIVAGCSLKKP